MQYLNRLDRKILPLNLDLVIIREATVGFLHRPFTYSVKPGSEGAKGPRGSARVVSCVPSLRVFAHTITKAENGPSTTRSLRENVDIFNYHL